jgi:bacterial leucyl aminopeptidase
LTEFNKKLVDTYLDIPWVGTKCGYACSDHASFSKAGYPSSFTIGKITASKKVVMADR